MARINYIYIYIALVVAALLSIHVLYILPIGFLSDDYALIQSAREGTRLWSLHYAPIMQSLWECTADGKLSSFGWRLTGLGFHWINAGLVFLLAKKGLQLSMPTSLFAATLFALNPAGIEAYAWTCSIGYVLTTTWILLAMICYGLDDSKRIFKIIALSCLQTLAFFTWDWGVLLMPVVFLYSLTRENSKLTLIFPGIVWFIGTMLRAFSKYPAGWHTSSLFTKLKVFLGAPFLGLAPQMDKAFYSSAMGIALALALLAIMVWIAYKDQKALYLLACFFISIVLWVWGGNPSGRYFYIPMLFLYLILACGFDLMKNTRISSSLIALILALECIWAYQRAALWNQAYAHSLSINQELHKITANATSSIILINPPEAYGPEHMPMRPQMWHCGLQSLIPTLEVVMTKGCPYVWGNREGLIYRDEIKQKYMTTKPIYEIVYESPNDWTKFKVVPFGD